MAHPTYKDAGGLTRSRKGTGAAGTNGDPDVFNEYIETIAAGASADIGATTDAAVNDGNGSLNAHARGIAKTLDERLPVSGQAAMANSVPVTLASDQTGLILGTGTNTIGAVKNAGPNWTRGTRTIVDSADASAGVDLSAAPTGGQYNVIDSLTVSVGAALTVTISCETSGAVLFKLYMAANTTITITEPTGAKLATADKKVRLTASGAGNIFAVANYHSEP